jgi:hypothetical protein
MKDQLEAPLMLLREALARVRGLMPPIPPEGESSPKASIDAAEHAIQDAIAELRNAGKYGNVA